MRNEDWNWRAIYDDGVLDEYDDDGESRGFAAIDQSRLVALQLISQHDHLTSHGLKITEESRPIFFRRRTRIIDTGEETSITCLGFQKTINGVNVKSFTFLFPDGSILVTDDLNAV